MFRAGGGVIPLGVMAVSLALGGPGMAQEPRLNEMENRIRTLQLQVEAALAEVLSVDSVHMDSIRRAKQVAQDTVLMGPFQIVTVEGQEALAKGVFNPLALEVLPMIRGSEETLRGTSFLFQYAWRLQEIFVNSPRVFRVQLSRRNPPDRLRRSAKVAVGRALHAGLPPDADSLRLWAGPRLLAIDEDWPGTYRELASTPSLAARRCYEGDLRWCWEALGLTDRMGGDREWYSPSERRELVRSRFGIRSRNLSGQMGRLDMMIHGCLNLREDRACRAALEGYPFREGESRRSYRTPLSQTARTTLVSQALLMGGEGSYTRLIAHPELPLRDRLVDAAGVSDDELASHWRERVMAARPNAQAGLLRSPATLLVWLLFFTLLATRSSRWRLG